MLPDDQLYRLLQEVNGQLEERARKQPSAIVRRQLSKSAGRFLNLQPLGEEEIKKLAFGRPVVAVDGSVNSVGAHYPHLLFIFQAYARSSEGDGVVLSDIITPLIPEHNKRLSNLKENNDLPEEYLLAQTRNRVLAALELDVATGAVEKFSPWLVLFDGGFMRFLRHAPAEWEHYTRVSRSAGVISVGVIEEAESTGLSRTLGMHDSEEFLLYDRELLFGTLNLGECLLVHPEQKIKSDFYTVFARLSRSPQAIACDFLPENTGKVPCILRYLYTITPASSRGVPLLLDIVDKDVRLTHRDLELILSAYLDAGLMEKFFVPHRKRRDY